MPIIDLSFEIIGKQIPLDHGYSLFAAICRVVPQIHGDNRIGVHPIRGQHAGPGLLNLIEASRLRVRLPSEIVAEYLALAGVTLDIAGNKVRIGIPKVEPLKLAAGLASRLVTFRHALAPAVFEANVRRELDRLEIAGSPSFVLSKRTGWEGEPIRRVLVVGERRVIGYALRVSGLNTDGSLRLQEVGLGGRRRFGCGVFVPMPVTLEVPSKEKSG